jgi:hypothetical protein
MFGWLYSLLNSESDGVSFLMGFVLGVMFKASRARLAERHSFDTRLGPSIAAPGVHWPLILKDCACLDCRTDH